jgi:hypothetical protein
MVDIYGVLLILFIAIVIYAVRRSTFKDFKDFKDLNLQQGGDKYILKTNQMVYARQYHELDNYNNVLNRRVGPPDANTNDLVGFEWDKPTDSQPAKLIPIQPTYLDLTTDTYRTPPKPSTNLKARVKARQPYFFTKPYVKNYYGKRYYADWRYPLFLVSTDFAENPAKFVREHPLDYPSYIIQARTPLPCDDSGGDKALGPYQSYEPGPLPGFMSITPAAGAAAR